MHGTYIEKNGNGILRSEQDRHCAYNVKTGRVPATIVAVEKQQVLCSECLCVALGIMHAMHMRHAVIRGLPGSKTFFHIIS